MNPAVVCRRVSESLSLFVVLLGAAVLLGWYFDIPSLKSVWPHFVTMKANTAFCFIFSGASLWFLQDKNVRYSHFRLPAIFLSTAVFAIGLLSFIEYLSGYDLGIDQLFFRESPDALLTSSPGRMAFNTSILFMLIGISLWMFNFRMTVAIYIRQLLALLIGLAALTAAVAYLYGAHPLLLGIHLSTAMAIHTSFLFALLSAAILFARPEEGFMKVANSHEFGGLAARKILPFTILIPIVLGWAKVAAEKHSWFSHEFGVVLLAIGNVVCLNSCIYILAIYLNQLDEKRQKAERTSRGVKEFISRILDAIADPVFVKDEEHRFVLVNKAECVLAGVQKDEQIGKTDYDYFPKSQVEEFWEKDNIVLKTGQENVNQELITDANGNVRTLITKKTRYIDSEGRAYVVGVIRDITELKMVEEALRRSEAALEEKVGKLNAALLEAENTRQMMTGMLEENNQIRKNLEKSLEDLKQAQHMAMQSEKLSSIGRLAGGVAHDFNNQLTVISGYADILLGQIHQDDPKYAEVEQIQRAAKRSSDLTRQLLAFSRRQVVAPKVLNLNDLIFDLSLMFRRLIGEDIELVVVPADDLGFVNVDPSQIEHVLTNITVNARDVMPQGGKLTITTTNERLMADDMSGGVEIPPGEYVVLSVSDTGSGMTDDVKSHVFEPFFTTKEKGKGTGLGLATVYGIVSQNKGFIRLFTELGKGTTFKIYFPRVESKAEYVKAPRDVEPLPVGSETILLVEDEPGILQFETQILRKQGYQIYTAQNGASALKLLETHAGLKVDLVVTDLVMPQMSGRELSERIKQSHPGIKFLYISGYTEDIFMHHGIFMKTVHFLQKPFSADALALKVREALDKP